MTSTGRDLRALRETGARTRFAFRLMVVILAFCAILAGPGREVLAQEADKPDTTASVLIDLSTGTLLAARNPDLAFAPGSTAKLMTAAVVFDAIDTGEISEDTLYRVSEHAWRTGGAPARVTTMFAALKSEVPVIDLLRGLLVQNANDAAIILAEGLSGSEAAFVERMNALAGRIGMDTSRFTSPTGHEDASARTSARDLSRLAIWLLTSHRDRMELFTLPDFTWNGIFQRNKNPLIGAIADLDGFVAGQSEKAGFNAVGTMERDRRRLVGVVAGHPSADAREEALRDLFDSLAKDYEEVVLYPAREEIARARVFGGQAGEVGLESPDDVELLLPRGDKHAYRLRVVYKGPLRAPVEKGATVGELRVLKDNAVVHRAPLRTRDAVEAGTVKGRAADALRETLFGWWLDGG
uniref:D-alanyl-D-alanine carboxypeptidase family protein n=1 Tax=Stappia sp. TaxID=1870903 RepID=UPI003BA8D025